MIIGFVLNITLIESNFKIGVVSSLELAVAFGILTLIIFFGWVLAIGLFVNSIPENPYRFKNGLLIFAVLSSLVGYSELNFQRLALENNFVPEWISIVLTPLTFFGIVYTFYNVPKSLKSIESGEKASFKEFIVDALLLFAFPIGVWIIQPRVNRIFAVNELTKMKIKNYKPLTKAHTQ